MTDKLVEIVNITSCELPISSKFKRVSPRKDTLKSPDYDEKFDSTTLAFDVFMSDDKLVFSGPPAYGLEEFFKSENFYLDEEPICCGPKVQQLDRTQRNWLFVEKKVNQFKWVYANIEFNISVNRNFQYLFRGKKTLFTLSKNNKFEWICDWIKFYKIVHHIDAVLFYDNNSDNYTLDELKQYLTKENLGVDIILVPWNFKYGPQGGISTGLKNAPWDSDFCQYGMMEHAKERFLKYAVGVINVDVDELIIAPSGESIFNELERNPALHISGKWIESIPLDSQAPVRFNNFFYYHKGKYKSDFKWCINPQKIKNDAQWKVHTIKKIKLKLSKTSYYLHYKAINYNWKVKRADFIDLDYTNHRFEDDLYNVIKDVFEVSVKPELKYKLGFWEKLIK
ncbi:glycosyltransferase family 92 protein [Acinetobacter junii]|uniref:hypothetical protein n=1 Tax=Acinetobacter junii TaxID=40215 RepID=UPI0035FC5B58